MFDRAIRDAKAGKPKVIELDTSEKQVTIRAAINKRIKTTGVDGVKVRAMGKDRLGGRFARWARIGWWSSPDRRGVAAVAAGDHPQARPPRQAEATPSRDGPAS